MFPLVQDSKVRYIPILGADKFAETFLGEFDTPEAIWGNDMRLVLPCRLATYFFVSCIMWRGWLLYPFNLVQRVPDSKPPSDL